MSIALVTFPSFFRVVGDSLTWIFSKVYTPSDSFALSAYASVMLIGIGVFRKTVASGAVILAAIISGFPNSSKYISSAGHRFKVLWVYARFVTTNMVDVKPLGNSTFGGFVGVAVRENLPSIFSCIKRPVTVSKKAGIPGPAGFTFYDSRPKALFKRCFHDGLLSLLSFDSQEVKD